MQSSLENKFTSTISKKSSRLYADVRSKFRFFLIFFLGLALGITLFVFGPKESFMNPTPIIEHINSVFVDCDTLSECFIDVIKVSEADLTHIFFIFISGFTYFCFAASGIIVFSKGFTFGFSLMFLIEIQHKIPNVNTIGFIIIFAVTKFVLCIQALLLASETYVFSYDFRAIKQNFSVLRRAPVTYKFIFVFIRTVGASLLVNFIYCLLIKLL